jgi:hypothetical protein
MEPGAEAERKQAIERYRRGEKVSAICASLNRSRVWFHRWLARADSGEPEWFRERSRRPTTMPRQTPKEAEAIVRLLRQELEGTGSFSGAQRVLTKVRRLVASGGCALP